jgi:hypothetical protein
LEELLLTVDADPAPLVELQFNKPTQAQCVAGKCTTLAGISASMSGFGGNLGRLQSKLGLAAARATEESNDRVPETALNSGEIPE